jgi:phosphoenolpyruvate carboxylase
MKIPRVMSTQHPDNVIVPFFAESPEMSGDDEVQEAYYIFSHLGCDEQMWDSEGKEVDDFVVRKLLTRYPDFFKQKVLGREVFLTLRIPNPEIEKGEAKVVLETLESIPRSRDAAVLFYGEEVAPIFEVILPMTTSARELDRIYNFYRNFIYERQYQSILPGDMTLADWIGEFKPQAIQLIPLFEDMEHMLEAHRIVEEYLQGKDLSYMRVFLARSDPALNYGFISAVLFNKIALQRLRKLSQRTGVKVYPILGAGSPPFRGNLTPYTVNDVLTEYPEVETFTVQSAFKYDYPVEDVIQAIKLLKSTARRPFQEIDEERWIAQGRRLAQEYQRQAELLAPLVNAIARFVPRRRMRKLHVGLFGYSRNFGKAKLPRAIGFCAALYSIGLPPEFLGLSALTHEAWRDLSEVYVNLEKDIASAARFFNPDCLEILPEEVRSNIKTEFLVSYQPNEAHRAITSRIIRHLKAGISEGMQEMIVEAGHIRRFLG